MALGVREQPDDDPHAGHLVGSHHLLATEALGLLERGADVVDLDVERDVAGVAVRTGPDAAADPVRILDHRVVGRPHRLAELPAEHLAVVLAQAIPVPAYYLVMNHRLTHLALLFVGLPPRTPR